MEVHFNQTLGVPGFHNVFPKHWLTYIRERLVFQCRQINKLTQIICQVTSLLHPTVDLRGAEVREEMRFAGAVVFYNPSEVRPVGHIRVCSLKWGKDVSLANPVCLGNNSSLINVLPAIATM